MTDRKKVVVAMSGGVDSSVSAALLVEQGYEVIGMMMRLWSEPGSEIANRCCTPDSMALARRVAAKLGIPFYPIDAQEVFRDTIVNFFVDEYARGVTPNPCLVCNRQIRWTFLLNHAKAFGADFMATGHYARAQKTEDGEYQLLRAIDRNKDQSYVLHVLSQDQLSHALFPLGNLTKPEVRQLARDFNLPVSERSDSQDLCFLGNGSYKEFLLRNAPQRVSNPGLIKTRDGATLGEHQGLAFYTIGQRKGLGIAAPEPLYVLDKDVETNTLIVGHRDELGLKTCHVAEINWTSGKPPSNPFRAQVMIRYKAREIAATIHPQEGQRAFVEFDERLRDITPGQAAVFFDGELVLGGGIIQP